MNKKLVVIKKALENYDYYCEFKDSNILEVCEEKDCLPFCFFLFDSNYPTTLLSCVGVDYDNTFKLSQVLLLAAKTTNIAASEPFYISKNDQHTYFGDEAYMSYELETIDLNDFEPISKAMN